jgi:VCBS repeat protein/FG-GAP repeat protein
VSVVVADFNGDGKQDLAFGHNIGNVVIILLGNGDGTFQDPRFALGGNKPFSVAVADFNSDGILDLAAASFTDKSVAVSAGNGDGTFSFQGEFPTDASSISVAVADFNGDGFPDLVVANRDANTLSILLNQTSCPPGGSLALRSKALR